jgi:thiol-disulfide isomerase/thioredoxin
MTTKPIARTFFTVLFICIAGYGLCQSKPTVISGHIEGLLSDTMLLSVSDFSYQSILEKKIPVREGRFDCSFIINSFSRIGMRSSRMGFRKPDGSTVFMRSRDIFFYAGPGDRIRLEGKLDLYTLSYTLQGNKMSEQSAAFRELNLAILAKETTSFLTVLRLRSENADKARIDSVNEAYMAAKDEYNLQRLKYMKQYPEQEVSADYLQLQEKDTILKYYSLLGPEAWATFQGRQLRQQINSWQEVVTGRELPEFTGYDADGHAIRLSGYRGKYLLIDFWGSWCGPCIADLPAVIEVYNQYRDKFNVLGIAISDNRDNLKKAIEKHKVPWKNILNNEADPLQDLSLFFDVPSVPMKFLVSPEGKLIRTITPEDKDLKTLLEKVIAE